MADEVKKDIYIKDLIRMANIPSEAAPLFDVLRLQAFDACRKVYDDRVVSYDGDEPCYKVFVYNLVSMSSVVYEKAWRLAQLTSPTREEPLRPADINRILDVCVDTMNYLSWMYAITMLATGYKGNLVSDDAPDYQTLLNLSKAGDTDE